MAKKLVETTHYSLSTTVPAQPDRRHGERYVRLLRVGALVVDGRRELCLIRNISAGGMMIRPYSTISSGTSISVELKQGDAVEGVVQWSDNGLVGVSFDQTIDVLALLSTTDGQPRPRMPRIDLSCDATLRSNGEVLRARVVNISQAGICVNASSRLEINADVVVSISGLHAAAAVVKWQEDDFYGIRFNRVYPVDELMAFLKEQQLKEQPRQEVA